MSDEQQQRVRLLTAPGPGGVAVVEVRGAEPLARLAALAGGRTARPGEVRLVRLVRPCGGVGPGADVHAATEDLDEALLVGADGHAGAEAPVVELHLHGSPPLVDEVLQLLGGEAARSHGGEAARSLGGEAARSLGGEAARSLGGEAARSLGGEAAAHVSLGPTFEARAEARLADVPTELGARVLVDQARGALRRALTALVTESPAVRGARLATLVARTDALRHLFVPVRVVLAGPVNAGKSTLFNLLAGEERAVVSPEPGTTRDAIGVDVTLGPYALRLVDTAGARELTRGGAGEHAVEAEVERAGQAVARTLVQSADVVLRLVRAGEATLGPLEVSRRSVTLRTCGDLVYGADPAAWPPDVIGVSTAPAESRARALAALFAALALPTNPDWVHGEAILCDQALRDEAARSAEAGACDDRALARLIALLDA